MCYPLPQRRLHTLQRLHHVRDPALLLRVRELGVRASAMAARLGVAEILRNNPFRAVDPALSEPPFHLGQLDLGRGRFRQLPLVV